MPISSHKRRHTSKRAIVNSPALLSTTTFWVVVNKTCRDVKAFSTVQRDFYVFLEQRINKLHEGKQVRESSLLPSLAGQNRFAPVVYWSADTRCSRFFFQHPNMAKGRRNSHKKKKNSKGKEEIDSENIDEGKCSV